MEPRASVPFTAQDVSDLESFFRIFNFAKVHDVESLVAEATADGKSSARLFDELFTQYKVARLPKRNEAHAQLLRDVPDATEADVESILRQTEMKGFSLSDARRALQRKLGVKTQVHRDPGQLASPLRGTESSPAPPNPSCVLHSGPTREMVDDIMAEECRGWVAQVVGDTFHAEVKSEANFVCALRSGVVLSVLLQKLRHPDLPDGDVVLPKRSTGFWARDTVVRFLSDAAKEYELVPAQLFTDADLCDDKNHRAVVTCLLAIAKVAFKRGSSKFAPSVVVYDQEIEDQSKRITKEDIEKAILEAENDRDDEEEEEGGDEGRVAMLETTAAALATGPTGAEIQREPSSAATEPLRSESISAAAVEQGVETADIQPESVRSTEAETVRPASGREGSLPPAAMEPEGKSPDRSSLPLPAQRGKDRDAAPSPPALPTSDAKDAAGVGAVAAASETEAPQAAGSQESVGIDDAPRALDESAATDPVPPGDALTDATVEVTASTSNPSQSPPSPDAPKVVSKVARPPNKTRTLIVRKEDPVSAVVEPVPEPVAAPSTTSTRASIAYENHKNLTDPLDQPPKYRPRRWDDIDVHIGIMINTHYVTVPTSQLRIRRLTNVGEYVVYNRQNGVKLVIYVRFMQGKLMIRTHGGASPQWMHMDKWLADFDAKA